MSTVFKISLRSSYPRIGFVALLVATVSSAAMGQVIDSAEKARNRAAQFLGEIKVQLDASSAKATFTKPQDAPSGVWDIVGKSLDFFLMIRDTDGAIVGFSDEMLGYRMSTRKVGHYERFVKTERDAWNVARSFLQSTGMQDGTYVENGIETTADLEGAETNAVNGGYCYNMRFCRRVPEYQGTVDDLQVSIDVVEGRVALFSSSGGFQYYAPSEILDKSVALRKIRELCRDEQTRYESEGQTAWAVRFKWPGDEIVLSSLEKRVTHIGMACLGSDYGQRLQSQRSARLVWEGSVNDLDIAIDAENGQPVFLGASKGVADGGKGSSKNYRMDEPKVGQVLAPKHRSASGMTIIWGGAGVSIVLGFLLAARGLPPGNEDAIKVVRPVPRKGAGRTYK